MIGQEKKKLCKKRFCKENEKNNPREVVKWANDLQRIKEVMKALQDVEKEQ